jgi:hypothetical protein
MHRYVILFPCLFVLASPAQKTPKKAKNSPRPCKIVMASQAAAHPYALVIQADGTYRKYPDAFAEDVKAMPECSDAPSAPAQRASITVGPTGGKIIP